MRNRLLALEHKLHAPPAKPGKPRKRRGKRRPGSPKRGQRPIAARHRRRVRVRAQSFDWDEPIQLTYNSERDSYVAHEPYAAAHDYEDESYDESYEASALDYDEDEGYEDGDYAEGSEASAFDYDEDGHYGRNDYGASAFGLDQGDEAEAFEVESFEVESFDLEDDEPNTPVGQTFSAVDLDEQTLAEDLDFSDLDAALKQDQPSKAMSDGDFAADLQAIISGQKTYDQDRGGMVGATPDAQQMSTAAAADSTSALPDDIREEVANPHDVFSQMAQHMPHNQMDSTPLALAKSSDEAAPEVAQTPHDVFDQMGHNMSYANSFDLGSISLEQRFDEFDEVLGQQHSTPPKAKALQVGEQTRGAAALALDEAALVEDIALMQATMPQASAPDDANQAMQFATERATVIKPSGATIYKFEKDAHGLGTSVKTGMSSSVVKVPFGKEISVDLGAEITQANKTYVFANDGGKIGYIRKDNVFPASFTLAQVLDHPRLRQALREQAKSQRVEAELDFYLAVDNLDADDQAGAIQIYDQFLHDEEYGEKKAQTLNHELQQLNAQVNPNYLLQADAPDTWRKTVNVGADRDAIQNNFPQLVHQNLFKKPLFLQSLGNSDALANSLSSNSFQLDPNLTDIQDAERGSVMDESSKNLNQDLIQLGLRELLSRPDQHGQIEGWFNI
ncbi:MAG: hypothetical protein AAFW84_34990 [Cyanobacteria bacterium J06635_15]